MFYYNRILILYIHIMISLKNIEITGNIEHLHFFINFYDSHRLITLFSCFTSYTVIYTLIQAVMIAYL